MIHVCVSADDEVSCEKIEDNSWYHVGSIKTCFMDVVTISAIGVAISTPTNTLTKGLRFSNNKNTRFLPENASQKFPNLVGYYARGCSIEKIWKINFQKLIKLRLLDVANNAIDKINDETFENLDLLEWLYLCELLNLKLSEANCFTFPPFFHRREQDKVSQRCCFYSTKKIETCKASR